MNNEFLKPRLTGRRFDNHTIPLEILKDFAALEEMVVEVAKWKYRQSHPDSKRVQRNFTQGLELHLAQVQQGSAIPSIVLAFSGFIAPHNAQFFEAARIEITKAISYAELGEPQVLPSYLLSYFDRFGRGLRAGEAIEFNQPDAIKAVLTPEIRKQLIKAAHVQEWTEEGALRGRICAVDQSKNNFQLELSDGSKLQATLAEQHLDIVLDALKRYHRDRDHAFVLLQGVVKKDHQDRLKSIETVEHISFLDPLDVTLRLAALALLRDGWLDGLGLAPGKEHLDWLAAAFDEYFDAALVLPYLYPTAEGNIQAEWSLGAWEVSLEVDLAARTAEYQAVQVETSEVHEAELNLREPAAWAHINTQLASLGGAQA